MALDPLSLIGQAAAYKVVGSGVGMQMVTRIMICLLGTEHVGDHNAFWLQLEIEKAGGKQLTAWVLLDDPRLSDQNAVDTRVRRYILQDTFKVA